MFRQLLERDELDAGCDPQERAANDGGVMLSRLVVVLQDDSVAATESLSVRGAPLLGPASVAGRNEPQLTQAVNVFLALGHEYRLVGRRRLELRQPVGQVQVPLLPVPRFVLTRAALAKVL